MRKVIARELVPSREEMLGWIRGLCAGPHRLAGSQPGRRAEESLTEWFRDLGLVDVVREPISLKTWEPEEAALECQGVVIPAYPIARSRFTGKEGLVAP